MKNLLLVILLIGSTGFAYSQQGRRANPSKRVQAEKDSVFSRIETLSEDQKLIIESLYADYESSVTKLMAGGRDNPQEFRQNLQNISKEKNQMMKEVLDEDQWNIYNEMLEEWRERRQQRRGNRNGRSRNLPEEGGKNH
ncbi:MAG: hypothetical protein AAFQ94_23130 [Bacteroidota bacterium]